MISSRGRVKGNSGVIGFTLEKFTALHYYTAQKDKDDGNGLVDSGTLRSLLINTIRADISNYSNVV